MRLNSLQKAFSPSRPSYGNELDIQPFSRRRGGTAGVHEQINSIQQVAFQAHGRASKHNVDAALQDTNSQEIPSCASHVATPDYDPDNNC